MTGFGLGKRSRTLLLWTARLALVAYLVQIMAFDHWHTHPSSIQGVENTSAHVAHCHGAGDCSDGGGAVTSAAAELARIPAPPAPALVPQTSVFETPGSVFIATPYEPPQVA